MNLTAENYFSPENQLTYIGASQFKSFLFCPAAALAEIRGEYRQEETTALLVGSYVDAYFEGTLDLFRAKHPDIFKRDGSLKSEYVQAEQIIQRIERDEMFMRYMSGQKQVIMTGEIAGVPFKIKIDSYHPGKVIVDQKIMKDLEDIWSPAEGRRVPYWLNWGYDYQGAIYREIVRQNTGDTLPFMIAAATKQKVTRLQIGQIGPARLDYCLDIVKHEAPRFAAMKRGEVEAERCEQCDYCAGTAVLSEIVPYMEAG
ncbi:PD-(D/E)XK nuclease-like domain-containing protein [Caproiciproducens faecalis]|uniref:PD-(D/E)XK nuclease-like domain-containing protein n=1 Tax=Caproiciproducens faecalis TaxID=2820301 RepID=A0ABS7DRF9_9FIRM|nr:PD-(D/E)XK nuclease-like domain-containing protein [Caproiciproducens faecalis]